MQETPTHSKLVTNPPKLEFYGAVTGKIEVQRLAELHFLKNT